jgi:hypothetical protein
MVHHSELAGMFVVKRFQRAFSAIRAPCKRQLMPDHHPEAMFMLA